MASVFYLSDGQETTGPFSLEELRRRHAAGELPATALIHDGQNWVAAAEFLRATAAPAVETDPERVLQQAILLEKKPNAKLERARWESLLFSVSFPVLIPSLIGMWITAKRWGHIDIYLILIDGIVFTWFGFTVSPWLGVLMLFAWLAAVFLYWLRRDRQRYGIFLGYSNLVCLLLIAGGALTIGGFAAVFPWKAFNRWWTIGKPPIVVNVARTENQAVAEERTLVLADETLDFANTLYRQKVNGEWKFVLKRTAERVSFDPAHVRAVWDNRDTLVGREAELTAVALSGFANVRDRVEVVDGPGKRMLEIPRHHFALVRDSDVRVWVVSAAPVTAGATVRGLVRLINNDAATGAAFAAARLGSLRMAGVAVFADEQAPPPPKPDAQETWVPVKNSRGAFWIRFPDGVTPAADAAAAGIVTGSIHDFAGLPDYSASLYSRTDGRVLLQEPPATYAAEQRVVDQMRADIGWKDAVWLLAGWALLGVASWRARVE